MLYGSNTKHGKFMKQNGPRLLDFKHPNLRHLPKLNEDLCPQANNTRLNEYNGYNSAVILLLYGKNCHAVISDHKVFCYLALKGFTNF